MIEMKNPKMVSYLFTTDVRVSGDVTGASLEDAKKIFDSRVTQLFESSNEDYHNSLPFGVEPPVYFGEVITDDCQLDFEEDAA